MFNKLIRDMEDIKIHLLKMRTTMCETKNTLDETNGKLDFAEGKFCELEVLATENIQNETQE